MNAVERFAAALPSDAVRRIAALEPGRFGGLRAPRTANQLDIAQAHACVIERWGGDLCGLLNALVGAELAVIARRHGVAEAPAPELRSRLWEVGAALEADGADAIRLQRRPIVLGGHLVVLGAPRGPYPTSTGWPRPVPPPVPPAPPAEEPDSLDELVGAADRAIGVRLGRRGTDKGAWGLRAAALLGVVERGAGEPDWRGDVEVKTVAVAREASGLWRVAEDPAIAMIEQGGALAKLERTLWLSRADVDDGDATIIAWYLLESDAEVARLVRRYLHERPKGPAGTAQRALYLHKRFFADAGLLATLNGPT